jgi:hypothetical protein
MSISVVASQCIITGSWQVVEKAYLEGTSLTMGEPNDADGRLPGHSLAKAGFSSAC